MWPPEATLAIFGVYLVFVVWICIGAMIWSWYSPFKKAQRASRLGVYDTMHESIPDALNATIILAIAQELACIFVLCKLILIYSDTGTKNPDLSTLLFHLICIWYLITMLCTIMGSIIVVSSFMYLFRLTADTRYDEEGRRTRRESDVNAESSRFSSPSSTRVVDSDSRSENNYRTFGGSRRNHDYANSPYSRAFVFKPNWWDHRGPIARMQPERQELSRHGERRPLLAPLSDQLTLDPTPLSPYPRPISGLQTEVSDADDEIEVHDSDLPDLSAMLAEANLAFDSTPPSPSPLLISRLQTEFSDADDEIDVHDEDSLGLSGLHAEANDVNRGRRRERGSRRY